MITVHERDIKHHINIDHIIAITEYDAPARKTSITLDGLVDTCGSIPVVYVDEKASEVRQMVDDARATRCETFRIFALKNRMRDKYE